MKLVVYPAVEPVRLTALQAAGCLIEIANCSTEADAVKQIADADALFGKLTPSMLRAAKKLRWVQSPTASLEHYLFPDLISHPCVLTNMRGLFSDVIADHVFGFILCFARNLHRYLRQQWEARWEPVAANETVSGTDDARHPADGHGNPPATTSPTGQGLYFAGPGVTTAVDRAHLHLADCTLGIVGLGQIGAEIARRGLAFGMRVLAVDPLQSSAPDGVALWRPERLPDLLGQSDFVVIAAPHTPATEKLFRRAQFQQMRRTAYLINIGRGAIFDLADLTAALQAGDIAGAGLDVFEQEPLPVEHPLWKMENVLITPHVAAASPRIAERHLAVVVENLRRFVRGEPLQNVVDKAQWF